MISFCTCVEFSLLQAELNAEILSLTAAGGVLDAQLESAKALLDALDKETQHLQSDLHTWKNQVRAILLICKPLSRARSVHKVPTDARGHWLGRACVELGFCFGGSGDML